ncbi:hypothetical protein HY638_02600 [Candidatus Woesearchaeota archaeon]|nr:hypothetical protein [Candidatus Woesearchaeota archaeon]
MVKMASKTKTKNASGRIIIPFFVIPDRLSLNYATEIAKLRRAYKNLVGAVEFYYEPKDKSLELFVESPEGLKTPWVEVHPRNQSIIDQLSINRNSSPIGREVPKGLVDVDYVRGADCVELVIGLTRYRVYAKPGLKELPAIDAEIPTDYSIKYGVKGGPWLDWTNIEMSPTEQLKELDDAFRKLRECTKLFYPAKRANQLYPSISLELHSFSANIMYVELRYLPSGGSLTCPNPCLEHIVFRQEANPKSTRAVVLGIHGGIESSIHIENVAYDLRMKKNPA